MHGCNVTQNLSELFAVTSFVGFFIVGWTIFVAVFFCVQSLVSTDRTPDPVGETFLDTFIVTRAWNGRHVIHSRKEKEPFIYPTQSARCDDLFVLATAAHHTKQANFSYATTIVTFTDGG